MTIMDGIKKCYTRPQITVHTMEMQSMLCAASETKGIDNKPIDTDNAWAPGRLDIDDDTDEAEADDGKGSFGQLW